MIGILKTKSGGPKKMNKLFESSYRFAANFATLFLVFVFRGLLKPRTGWITIGNLLSLSRVFFFGPLILWMSSKGFSPASILVAEAIGALTDLLDGAAAKIEGTTKFGAALDPICDKIFVACCCYPVLSAIYSWPWGINMWPFKILVAFEGFFLFMSAYAYFFTKKVDIRSTKSGKTRFNVECVGVIALQVGLITTGNILLITALPLAVATMIEAYLREKANKKDLPT